MMSSCSPAARFRHGLPALVVAVLVTFASFATAQFPLPTIPFPVDPSQRGAIDPLGTLEGTLDGEPSTWQVYGITTDGAEDMSLAFWSDVGGATQLFIIAFPEAIGQDAYLIVTAEASGLPSGCPCTFEGDGVFTAVMPLAADASSSAAAPSFLEGALFSGFDDGRGAGGMPASAVLRFDTFKPNGDGSYAATGSLSATLVGFQDMITGASAGAGSKLDLRFDIRRFTPEPMLP